MANQIKRRYANYQTGDVLRGSEEGDNGPIATAEAAESEGKGRGAIKILVKGSKNENMFYKFWGYFKGHLRIKRGRNYGVNTE